MTLSVDFPSLLLSVPVNALIFLAASAVLIKGSDIFVDAAAAIARSWHVSELVIGLTLVSIGTSLPELSTSILAQIRGESDFVIGNIAGSNVTNITLILGAALAVGGSMPFSRHLMKRDTVIMNLVFLITVGMFFICPKITGASGAEVRNLNRICGMLLFIGGIVYSWVLFRFPDPGSVEEESGKADGKSVSVVREFLLLILGLVMIVSGSEGMVDTVQWAAVKTGVPTIVISATIVAFGTSVPELAVTIAGVLKNKCDMAVGNIVGSCSFNILLIFGLSAVVRPLAVNSGLTGMINLLLMIPTGLLLILFMALNRRTCRMPRICGIVFLILYAGFLAFNVKTGISAA